MTEKIKLTYEWGTVVCEEQTNGDGETWMWIDRVDLADGWVEIGWQDVQSLVSDHIDSDGMCALSRIPDYRLPLSMTRYTHADTEATAYYCRTEDLAACLEFVNGLVEADA